MIKMTVQTRMAFILTLATLTTGLIFFPAAGVHAEKSTTQVNVGPAPETKVVNVVETMHGVEITDPYRWLEDQDSPETRAWIDRQNAYTDSILTQVPGRKALRKLITKLMKIDTISTPIARGNRYFLSKQKADQDLSVIYMREGLNGEDRILFDPHSLTEDHSASAGIFDVSKDGKLLVYYIRQGGVDDIEIRFMDVDTNKDLPDVLPAARYFGVSLTPDKRGFYYTRFGAEGARTYFHMFGTSADKDKMIFGEGVGPDKAASVSLSDDGDWLVGQIYYGSSGPTEIYVKNVSQKGHWIEVIKDGKSRSYAGFAGDKLVIQTDMDAPNRRLMIADLTNPSVENWKELIPEQKDAVLEGGAALGGKIVASYLKDVHNLARVYDLKGNLVREITFDSIGSFSGGSGTWESREVFFSFSSFHIPQTIYRYDMETGNQTVWARIRVPVNTKNLELKQVHYSSKDGTRIPMFILHKKNLTLNSKNPVMLYGYGGFNASMTPTFSSRGVAWVESGGVFCVANLRGGGEFGETWHQAGMLEKKQNTFDDFIAAARWLIANKYTSPQHLGIMGGSNGGLLVGACMTQQPDLFGAVICTYPLLDMIRYHHFMLARFWVPEYGSSEDPEQFRYILAYSPYHHVKEGVSYPATLFITGDGDNRVAPLHARKMAALMQAKNSEKNPIMLRYYTKAGHSGGMPLSERIDQTVQLISFLKWQLESE